MPSADRILFAWVETMKTCACCGQALETVATSGRLQVQVDEELLGLCNQAYEAAREWNSAGVEIAHLVWCLTRDGMPERCFEQEGFRRAALSVAAERWLGGARQQSATAALQTSHELKLVLARAERVANAAGRHFASPLDFLKVLAHQVSDLRTAQFAFPLNVLHTADMQSGKPATISPGSAGGSGGLNPSTYSRGRSDQYPDRQAGLSSGGWTIPPATSSFVRNEIRDDCGGGSIHSERAVGSRAFEDDDDYPIGEISQREPAWALDRWSRPEGSDDITGGGDLRRADAARGRESARQVPREATKEASREAQGGSLRDDVNEEATLERDELLERLNRQEQLVSELSRVIGRLLDERGSETVASTRGTAGNASSISTTHRQSHASGAGQREAARSSGSSADMGSRKGSGTFSKRGNASGDYAEAGQRGVRRWKRALLRRRVTTWAATASGDAFERDGADAVDAPAAMTGFVRRTPRQSEAAIPHPRYRTMRDLSIEYGEGLTATPDNDTDDDDATGERPKRFYLSPDDEIVKAPSIGPKTAERLNPVGLVLVRDLLRCDPHQVAARAANRYITADRIACWKAQARLVCTIPWLRGTHAQLLVGAGYDTLNKLIRADTTVVCAAILRFAATREGLSILRTGPAPEIDRIACWIENAALAEPARAA